MQQKGGGEWRDEHAIQPLGKPPERKRTTRQSDAEDIAPTSALRSVACHAMFLPAQVRGVEFVRSSLRWRKMPLFMKTKHLGNFDTLAP